VGLVITSAGILLAAVAPAGTAALSHPASQEQASPHQEFSGRALSGTSQAADTTLSSVTAAPTAFVAFGFESAGAVTRGTTMPVITDLPVTPPEVAPPPVAPPAVGTRPADATPVVEAQDALGLPVAVAHVSSTFGYRVDPMTGHGAEFHAGIDYAGACGTPVVAADGGIVSEAGWHAYGGGQRVVVDHGAGLRTTYNHLGALGVGAGRQVDRGELLGAVGSTGNSTGCHLHFEVMVDDEKVDPQAWLQGVSPDARSQPVTALRTAPPR
jgi:murein DD-endopeptidase MepM/ murein hydrolase activator NlpD